MKTKTPKAYDYNDYKNMSIIEQEEYKKCKGDIIIRYMGVLTTSESSLQLRTKAYLEETKSSFYD